MFFPIRIKFLLQLWVIENVISHNLYSVFKTRLHPPSLFSLLLLILRNFTRCSEKELRFVVRSASGSTVCFPQSIMELTISWYTGVRTTNRPGYLDCGIFEASIVAKAFEASCTRRTSTRGRRLPALRPEVTIQVEGVRDRFLANTARNVFTAFVCPHDEARVQATTAHQVQESRGHFCHVLRLCKTLYVRVTEPLISWISSRKS